MKTDKLWIKLVKGLAVFLMVIVILTLGLMIFFFGQAIQQIPGNPDGSAITWNLLRQFFAQMDEIWKGIMRCLALLGGVQILIWFARNRQSFRKLVKTGARREA